MVRALRTDGTEVWRIQLWRPVELGPVALKYGLIAIGGNGGYAYGGVAGPGMAVVAGSVLGIGFSFVGSVQGASGPAPNGGSANGGDAIIG